MEKREAKRKKSEWETAERFGGGPEMPEGNAELSNRTGEMRERGLAPPPAEPILPNEIEGEPGDV